MYQNVCVINKITSSVRKRADHLSQPCQELYYRADQCPKLLAMQNRSRKNLIKADHTRDVRVIGSVLIFKTEELLLYSISCHIMRICIQLEFQ